MIKFSKKNDKKLGKLKYHFEQKIKEWNAWVDEAKTCIWKLPISLDDYISTFNKNAKLYKENLESAEDLHSAKKYVDSLSPFTFPFSRSTVSGIGHAMPGRIIKNQKGQKVVTSYQFIDFFEKNIDKEWHWPSISKNSNITIDIVQKYPDQDWIWWWLSTNTNITMDIVERHPNKPWNWNWLSCNPNITIDIINAHPGKLWNWNYVLSMIKRVNCLKIVLAI